MMSIAEAEAAIANGGIVVYPTETVYGLGGDALDPTAIERVFDAKNRDRNNPISLGLADSKRISDFVSLSPVEKAFIDEFLPGPVTVVCERRNNVPDILTAGRDKVGIRVPNHQLARELLASSGPLTATSANKSGNESVCRVEALDPQIRAQADVVLDGGETPGTESTVVDVQERIIHRRGSLAQDIETWLNDAQG
ncbi:MAG: L-threonylcarbamoyladenylate synthase [Halobacteriaceae archaeon]